MCLRFTPRELFLLFTGGMAEKMIFLKNFRLKIKYSVGKACQLVDAENNAAKILAAADPSWRGDPGNLKLQYRVHVLFSRSN